MKKWILVAMCVFLYTMPVHATEYSVVEETASTEENVEEGSDSLTEVIVEEENITQQESLQTEEVLEPVSTSEITSESVEDAITGDETEGNVTEETTSGEEVSTEEAATEVTPTEETTEVAPTEAATEVAPTEEAAMEGVSTEEGVADSVEVTVPEVSGMTEEDAVAALESVELSDGSKLEVIKIYKYTDSAQKGMVYEMSMSDEVSEDGVKQVTIYISEGEDPDIVDMETKVNWDEIPESYEYNWDNSQNCWNWGVWIEEDGVLNCYKTEEGTYDTNVRHKIQLYTDGTYVYTRIVFSRDYLASANGNWYNYTIDGNTASFQVEQYDGKDLANNNLEPGTYGVVVRHANGDGSYVEATGASAYYTVNESQVNAELEIKIPLSELVEQNGNIDLESVGMIEFFTPNLMYQSVKTAGASTSPFTSAVSALVLVPGAALFMNKKRKIFK